MKQSEYIDFKGIPQTIFHSWERDEDRSIVTIPTYYVTATDIIKFIPEPVLEKISPIIDRIFITETCALPENELDIPKIVQVRDGLYEDVSDLNGIAIPSIYYDLLRGNTDGTNVLKEMIQANLQEIKPGKHAFLKEAVSKLPDVCCTPADYLFLANVYVAVQEKLYFKLKQITPGEYNWLTVDIVNKCMTTLKCSICPSTRNEFEKQIIHHSFELEHAKLDAKLYEHFGYETKFRFSARIDLLTNDTLWELKCTSNLTMDHKLQVIIYAWLWRVLFEGDESTNKKEHKLLNIRTGEILRLDATVDELTEIVVSLLKGKYGKNTILTDEEFIANCKDYILADTIFCESGSLHE
jgi:hypothetical protein